MKTLFFAIGCVLLMIPHLYGQEKIVIATGLKPPLVSSENRTGFLDILVTEAFKRMGIKLEILILPAERALINANNGIEDGCLLRIKGLEKKFPNLVMVPEKLLVSRFVAYSSVEIGDEDSLEKYQSFYLSYITGWQIFDQLFENHPLLTKVRNANQMFSLLKGGRVDVVLYEQWQGLWILKELQITNIHLVQPPLISLDQYMYLHQKHRNLVPKLAEQLAALKKDGSYDLYHRTYLESLIN